MNSVTIRLPKTLYERVIARASARQQEPESVVVEILQERLLPGHPYVKVVSGRGGLRPVIKGTRVGVDVIVGYTQAGYEPQEIAAEILPQLSLAQVYDALSYYEDHRESMDIDMAANSPEAWQARLRREMGETAADTLLGN
jgi:uncharacterized protein (DUF433 family)